MFGWGLIYWAPKPPDFQIPHGIAVLADGIIGVALNRIYSSVLHFLDNANVIGVAGQTVRGPVKENDIPGIRNIVPLLPLAVLLKPSHTAAGTACKLGHYAGVDVPARVGAPGNEAGAPIHMLAETIPAPIRLAANIAIRCRCRHR